LLRFSGAASEINEGEGLIVAQDILQRMQNASKLSAEHGYLLMPHDSTMRNDCEDYRYAPTYWLSAETERRRAVYLPIVVRIACEFGLPARLLDAVIAQESGYNSRAISPAGAMGMMQIMPGTARSLGLAFPWDPIANIRAGARYLRDQANRFGRIDLALAAYNAGPERKSLNAGYIPAIPETMTYVRTITTNWARLATEAPIDSGTTARASAADLAIKASGYREVDLSVYEGMNAANPI